MLQKINEAILFINSHFNKKPEIGIILGSGLGCFENEIIIEKEIAYSDIPFFATSTVAGHNGKLIFGTIEGKVIVAMAGRFHFYEGYNTTDIIFPIRVLKYLGIKLLMISNAAGATNSHYKIGDLMIINDHISFFTPNPLIGINNEAFGTRFPDMNEPYCKKLIKKAKEIAIENNIIVHEGTYCSVTGPTFETKAEYKLLSILGCDAIGMSTVQEVIAAVHMGLKVFAISVITDLGMSEGENKITHNEVLDAAKKAEPSMATIFLKLIAQF